MKTLENKSIYENIINIDTKELSKLNDKIKKHYYDIREHSVELANCFSEEDQRSEILRISNANEILNFDSFELGSNIVDQLILFKTYFKVDATVIYYSKLSNIIDEYIIYKNEEKFLQKLYLWVLSDEDINYFDYKKKEEIFNIIKSYIHIHKEVILNEQQVETLALSYELKLIDSTYLKKVNQYTNNKRIIDCFYNKNSVKEKLKKINYEQ